jgi:hypothetical protein
MLKTCVCVCVCVCVGVLLQKVFSLLLCFCCFAASRIIHKNVSSCSPNWKLLKTSFQENTEPWSGLSRLVIKTTMLTHLFMWSIELGAFLQITWGNPEMWQKYLSLESIIHLFQFFSAKNGVETSLCISIDQPAISTPIWQILLELNIQPFHEICM